MLGRWTRPTRTQDTRRVNAAAGAYAAELSEASEREAGRLLAAMRTEAYEEEESDEEQALNAPTAAKKLSATLNSRSNKLNNKLPLASAASANLPDTMQQAAASVGAANTPPDSALAAESITPKTVVAKDVVAMEERQNYAAQLPNVLLQKGVEAKVSVVGEQADVIIMSSPSFDAQSKDSVIKQVCIDLKALGFKRVHITDGKDYTMHFGL
ncbi:hypothetical protein [Hymenobacter radiodurans]|uniref:hypothetical protein n=1 Tax=Hymenobacter radiodurans TaxID=2496028 RepID=UPI0010587154|nr:hypothetical protein [Hymenobacter radiodurans]